MKKLPILLPILVFLVMVPHSTLSQEKSEESALAVVNATNTELAKSQQTINQLSNTTAKLLQEYRDILQQKDYQQYYNFQLKQTNEAQQQEISDLQKQLQELDYIEVAIMPLMQSMLVALEEFVVLDIPFLLQTRMDGLSKLRSRLNSGSISLPEKYRLLMEAWQIEHDYGRSIEAWRGLLSTTTGNEDDRNLSVDYLRIGRTAFYYMTLDESKAALWDKASRSWVTLPEKFIPDLKRSMQIASERVAPELMPLPLATRWDAL